MPSETCLCEVAASGLISNRPFEVSVETAYYDGPVSGVVRCQGEEEYYRFEMLDWDHKQQIRIFGLAAMDISSATMCIQLDEATPDWNDSSSEAQASVASLLKVLLPFDHMYFLIAWENPGLAIVAAKGVQHLGLRLPGVVFFERPDEETDWFTFLGLAK